MDYQLSLLASLGVFQDSMEFTDDRYRILREAFRGHRLPLAFVDLDAFDANVDYVAGIAEEAGKTLRIGTKSLRCLPLMERILVRSYSVFNGFLTFTAEETEWLASRGHDDFLLAYPTVQHGDLQILARLAKHGNQVSSMVDSIQHLRALEDMGRKNGCILKGCIEIDTAFRPLGIDALHLGLRRSPLRTSKHVLELVSFAKLCSHVKIDSLMGYEGHIAGTNDDLPRKPLKNLVLRAMKYASVGELSRRRQAVVRVVQEAGVDLRLVNGGGSGSIRSTLRDPSVTESTIGSGLYGSGLFHHFKEVKFRPSAFFALQAVRTPKQGMVTCAGGGYIASGAVDKSKLPLPVMPCGLEYLTLEGAGEVQTPLKLPKGSPRIELGDPVFFQHAKAGELCERFNDLILIQGGKIIDEVRTYRGEGCSFL